MEHRWLSMELWLFLGLLIAAYLIPGPDMILVLHTGAAEGRAQAFAVAAGLAAARGLHVALAAFGLAALFLSAPGAFEIARGIGAGYLIWLGLQMLRSAPGPRDGLGQHSTLGWTGVQNAAWLRGLLTNLLNPKSLLFCSVLLPQFVQPGQSAMLLQFAGLGVVVVVVGLLFDAVYAVAGTRLGHWLTDSSGMQRLQRWGFSALLIGFGIRLAFIHLPQ